MASTDWQSSLGFSNRLTEVTKITTATQDCFPGVTQADARRDATTAEARIYDEATSVDDYRRKCAERIRLLLEKAPKPFQLEEDPEPVPESSGIDIGRFKSAIYLAEGLFSVVYKAVAPVDATYFSPDAPPKERLVALKVATPSMMQPPHDCKREVRILELSASDHVIPVLETFREDGTHFIIVFPFVQYQFGQLLSDKKLSKDQTKGCLQNMFSALKFIHAQGIIHRDIKPSNVLVKSLDGPAYLSDFGIAWAPNVSGSEAADSKITDVGTTCYRPPELLFGNKQYGCTLDLWAAGCTVAEAVVPDHHTLFDSGELGSDLALIQSMFSQLGTPNLTVWPEAADLPDWGKMEFREYPPQTWEILLPDVSETERDLVSRLVRYESGARMTAAQILQHSYFSG